MNNVYNTIYDELRSRLATINVKTSDSYQLKQSTFPIVIIEEVSNTIDTMTLDSDGVFMDNVSIEMNIYTNSKTPRKETKPIIDIIEQYMINELRTNRNFSNKIPNYLDENIFRYTLRYSFFIDKNNTIYRR